MYGIFYCLRSSHFQWWLRCGKYTNDNSASLSSAITTRTTVLSPVRFSFEYSSVTPRLRRRAQGDQQDAAARRVAQAVLPNPREGIRAPLATLSGSIQPIWWTCDRNKPILGIPTAEIEPPRKKSTRNYKLEGTCAALTSSRIQDINRQSTV